MKNRGFTLIELLVVIAVIGILAAVILASLNSARDKGKVAAIKSNLNSMIAQAEIHFSNTGSYGTICASDGPLQPMMNAITAIVGVGKVKCYVLTELQSKDWGVTAVFNDKNYTVNSQGVVTFDSINIGGSTSEDWITATAACANVGKRLPSIGQLKSMYDVYNDKPTGFDRYYYWTLSEPLTDSSKAYNIHMDNGNVHISPKAITSRIRCVG